METTGWGWPQVLAHRCGGALAPENSLAGLDIAARLGCAAVEFDVMLSRDGVPVLIHDETLDRTAGLPGRVPELDAVVLAGVDIGRLHHRAFAGEGIPRFNDALARCRLLGLAANVEIKPAAGAERATADAVAAVVAACPSLALPALLFSSFSRSALDVVAQVLPATPRALLAERFDNEILTAAQALGCCAIHLGAESLRDDDVAAVHAAGLKLQVYTVNQTDAARALLGLGVDGLFTDRPDLLLGVDRMFPA